MNSNEHLLSGQLEELSHRLQSISMAIDETIWDHDIQRNTIRYNDRMVSMFGYPADEIDGAVSWWYSNLHPDDVSSVKTRLAEALESGDNRIEMKYRYRCSDGTYKPVYDRALILRDARGTPVRMIGVMQDMTGLIQQEHLRNRLRDTVLRIATSESIMSGRDLLYSLNHTLEESTQALEADWGSIWVLDADGCTCMASYKSPVLRALDDHLDLNVHVLNEILDEHPYAIVHDSLREEDWSETAKAHFRSAGTRAALVQLIRVKGSPRAVLVFEQQSMSRSWTGDEVQFASTIADQSAQIMANAEILEKEHQLEQSLLEKETLLQEIHHRVKNNLAVVSSLMQLQAMETTNEEVREHLLDSTTRIRSMALIHEELYQNDNFTYLDIQDTIRGLVDYASSIMQGDRNVRVDYRLEPVRVNINQAVPLSLIVNEVVTNCYKHAFSGIDHARMTITSRLSGRQLHLCIEDNGKGLPQNFDPEAISSLGMQLLYTLTEQLSGTYSLSSEGEGTRFTLAFDLMDVRGAHSAL